MDFFDLNKSELSAVNIEKEPQMGEVSPQIERVLAVPERENVSAELSVVPGLRPNPVSVESTSIPSSSIVRQTITVAPRFRELEASGEDVIESAWVGGVKKTLKQTWNQPSRRDDEIRQIRQIYQEKRKSAS